MLLFDVLDHLDINSILLDFGLGFLLLFAVQFLGLLLVDDLVREEIHPEGAVEFEEMQGPVVVLREYESRQEPGKKYTGEERSLLTVHVAGLVVPLQSRDKLQQVLELGALCALGQCNQVGVAAVHVLDDGHCVLDGGDRSAGANSELEIVVDGSLSLLVLCRQGSNFPAGGQLDGDVNVRKVDVRVGVVKGLLVLRVHVVGVPVGDVKELINNHRHRPD